MKIQVTDWHIKHGIRGSSTCCPVALAVEEASRAMYGTCNVLVSDIIYINHHSYPAPQVVKKFIADFDEDKQVEPIEFEL